MKAFGVVAVALLSTGVGLAQAPAPSLQGAVCTAEGRFKGSQRTAVITSQDGHERVYGQLKWDRPQRWTHRRCEAVWWVYASADGAKFMPILGRQDFLNEGQQSRLAVVGFSAGTRRAAVDVMTVTGGRESHGYFVADLREHTSCFGSAVRGLDGVRSELQMGHEPALSDATVVRDDGWLELLTPAGGPPPAARTFEPCSGKLRVAKP